MTFLRGCLQLGLTYGLATAVLKAADLLSIQCFIDDCSSQLSINGDWLDWVSLADQYMSEAILMAVLNSIPVTSTVSAYQICSRLKCR